MTSELFAREMVRMEALFKVPLSEHDRRAYYRALAMIPDREWLALAEYVTQNWRKTGSFPLPGQFREWAGLDSPTPAQAATQTKLPAGAMLGALPAAAAVQETRSTGSASAWSGPFWPDMTTQLVYEDEASRLEIPSSRLWHADAVLAVVKTISERAEAKLAAARRTAAEQKGAPL